MEERTLLADELDSIYRRWVVDKIILSEKNNPYPSFGLNDAELVGEFVVLIKVLKNDYGLKESYIAKLGERFVDKITPRLPYHTTAKYQNWRKARLDSWEKCLALVFGKDNAEFEKYRNSEEQISVSKAEPVKKEESLLPHRPPIPDNIGIKDHGDDDYIECNPLEDLGQDDE